MDLTPNPTASKSPNDAANDLNPLSSTNGAHYKHPRRGPRQPLVEASAAPTQPSCSSTPVTYGECLKNHAASLGGHAVDGCGEFMPSPSATPTDPTSLKCAACGCHRNFHRRDPDSSPTTTTTHFLDFHHLLPPAIIRSSPSPSSSPSTSPPLPHVLLSLSTAATEDHQQEPETPTAFKRHDQRGGRKRSRTKFSQDQKEKMYSFSEKLGWKLQKSDEEAVEEFCRQIGVSKGVLKVWMHNNKNTYAKREINTIINKNDSNSNRVVNDDDDENKNIKGSSSSS